jgi:hypothetical protein
MGDSRISREKRTIEAMISIYCCGTHGSARLCPECRELALYYMKRLDACPFKELKPICFKCQTHCYKPEMRGRLRDVMVYSGPRIAYRHPTLALMHLLDGRRKTLSS